MSPWWSAGDPIQVVADELGLPMSFIQNGKLHKVARVTRRWRIDNPPNLMRGRIWREYFKLKTKDKVLIEIYHDLIGGRWYAQRLFG